jgi:pimeloyl-ACP methyl ester carboxylesterase
VFDTVKLLWEEAQVTEQLVRTNGVELCVETFGEPENPAILLIMGAGASMLDWDAEFCQRLASAGRFVIRYDNRDTGRSVSYPAGDPPYGLRDLVSDALGLLDALDLPRAHIVGMSMGAAIGQLLALDHPDRVASLTLLSGSPGGPGFPHDDLPGISEELRAVFREEPQPPDWSDREAVIAYHLQAYRPCAGSHGFDEVAGRELAGRVFDRTADMASSMTNHFAMDPGEPWRDRLKTLEVPTLVLHGSDDPFLPFGHGQALADEIPGAELIAMGRTGHEAPPRSVWDVVIPAISRHTASR